MGDSLQDQLRALGLAREEPKRRSAKKKQSRNKAEKTSGKAPGGEPSLARLYALREQEEQRQADLARKRKQAKDRRRREINRAIREIVTSHRQNDDAAEIARNFLYKGRIRKIYVTADQQRALVAGELGIVFLTGGYHLLLPDQVDAVRAISPEHVVDLNSENGDGEDEHPVPDDLVW